MGKYFFFINGGNISEENEKYSLKKFTFFIGVNILAVVMFFVLFLFGQKKLLAHYSVLLPL
jgi:hypothetical protein